MLTGDIHVTVDNIASYLSVIRDGSVRVLAIADTKRWPTLPDVPTVEEAGLPGYGSFNAWHILAGPAGMPGNVSERLVGALREWANDAQAQSRAINMGARLIGAPQTDTIAFIRAESPRWAEHIRLSGYQPE
jgi:tripartite-type tricarboxylate transporter receptor subunit TctC